jgi:pimeloyl-ACP methyl ester carboxylesterase
MSQGCAVSVAYAIRHPEQVSRLILYGGFAVGPNKRSSSEKAVRSALVTLAREGWGKDNPAFRQVFTSMFIPGGTKEQADWFNELQRRTTSPECAARYLKVVGEIDVRPLLAQVKVPTLIMHVRNDAVQPFEAGRKLAAAVPGARFVALEGRNHVPLEHEVAAKRLFDEVELFLAE